MSLSLSPGRCLDTAVVLTRDSHRGCSPGTLTGDAHQGSSPGSHFGGRVEGQQDPAPTQADGQASGGDTGASRSRKGSGKEHTADGLELVHSKSEKQAAAGISGASLLKPMALPQGRVLAQGALF